MRDQTANPEHTDVVKQFGFDRVNDEIEVQI